MRIKKLTLNNFKGFEHESFAFHDKLNLIVGVNGSGKSTVLESLVLSLSWVVKRIQRDNAQGLQIPESSIRIGTESANIEISLTFEGKNYDWNLTKAARGQESNTPSYKGATDLADIIRVDYENKSVLPVIVNYSVKRTVNNIRPDLSSFREITIFDVYENALKLNGTSSFRALFTWFRNRDDILNEQTLSRSEWMKQKREWVQSEIKRIIQDIEHYSLASDKLREGIVYLNTFLAREYNLDQPQIVLSELANLVGLLQKNQPSDDEFNESLLGIEKMFQTMTMLSSKNRDNLIEDKNSYSDLVKTIYKELQVTQIERNQSQTQQIFPVVWRIFTFAILLAQWWMSEGSRFKINKLLQNTYPPLKNTNEDEFIKDLRRIIIEDKANIERIQQNEGQELQFVKQAIEEIVPEFTNLQMKRTPRPRLELTKGSVVFNLNTQLSDGEKNLIALIGDIARRLTMANPQAENPLEGEGIILIDEIDLHLHPKWQRIVAEKLPQIFPNCQFFLTTHSPQVINHVKPESVFLLHNSEGSIVHGKISESYGKNSDRVLEDIMGVLARPDKIDEELQILFQNIQEGDINLARKQIAELREKIGNDSELVKANVIIKRREILGK